MKYIIQSKAFGDTKWNFRNEAHGTSIAIRHIIDAKRVDLRLRVNNNSYRIIDKSEKVIFILPDYYYPRN